MAAVDTHTLESVMAPPVGFVAFLPLRGRPAPWISEPSPVVMLRRCLAAVCAQRMNTPICPVKLIWAADDECLIS